VAYGAGGFRFRFRPALRRGVAEAEDTGELSPARDQPGVLVSGGKAKGWKVAVAVRLSTLFLASKVRKGHIMASSSWVKGGKSAGCLHFIRVRFLDALRPPPHIVMFPANRTSYSGR
jgi:hypothetical protein